MNRAIAARSRGSNSAMRARERSRSADSTAGRNRAAGEIEAVLRRPQAPVGGEAAAARRDRRDAAPRLRSGRADREGRARAPRDAAGARRTAGRGRPRAGSILPPSSAIRSSRTGTAISAAAVGVGARRSLAWSISVVSVSCPTAEISGIAEAAAARTTISSLNAIRSSRLPPPRATMISSRPRHRTAFAEGG